MWMEIVNRTWWLAPLLLQVEGNRRELWLHFTLPPVTATEVVLAGVGVGWAETPTALVCGAFSCIGISVLFSLLCVVSPEFSNILTLPDVSASDVDRVQCVNLDPKQWGRGNSYPHSFSMKEWKAFFRSITQASQWCSSCPTGLFLGGGVHTVCGILSQGLNPDPRRWEHSMLTTGLPKKFPTGPLFKQHPPLHRG